MSKKPDLPINLQKADFQEFIENQRMKSLLRFITCGSVDDGKSTLIGRLLYDANLILDDQLGALHEDSKRHGTQGSELDFALLVDGLTAEQEQGITIDVAYRYFSTPRRKFIVADTPGHEQYTKNMVTGASNADLALLLIDARKGVLTQSKRHSYIVNLLGIKEIIVAINKMDLVEYDESKFLDICEKYYEFAKTIGLERVIVIPISGLKGDNIVTRSMNMPWYDGPTLIDCLENIEVSCKNSELTHDFSLPVQMVLRPHSSFRGYSGLIASGKIKIGECVSVLPNGNQTRVSRLVTGKRDLDCAFAGQSITICFEDEIDCSRGDVIMSKENSAEISDIFDTTIIWMSQNDMVPGRPLFLKVATQTVSATLKAPKYSINMNTLEKVAVKTLGLNFIGSVIVTTERPIVFESYTKNRTLGSFILIDKNTHATVAAGMINFCLRRSQNIPWQLIEIDKNAHAVQKAQTPYVIWFTGISGSGKSTIANLLQKKLFALNFHTYLLDGDNLRHGICKDLGFTETDRFENIRRIAEIAKLMTDAGLIVLTAAISPFEAQRSLARGLFLENYFIEVFIDTPLEIAERRDPKGLYSKARAGELVNFTGVDSPYEPPQNPEIIIDTTKQNAEESADSILEFLLNRFKSNQMKLK